MSKYESYTLKATQVSVSEPKCCQSSVVTLIFHLLTPKETLTSKCIGISLSPFCIYVWNMKAVSWKLLKLSCQNQSVDKVPLWPWPLTFLPQNVQISSSRHTASIYEIWKLYTENYSSYRVRTKILAESSVVTLTFDLLTSKFIGIFLSPTCIYVWNMKAQVVVSEPKCWRTYWRTDGLTDRQTWFL